MAKIESPASPLIPKLEGLHLFHFDGAPCAQRVRFALAEKGLSRGREVKYDDTSEASWKGEEGAWTSRIVSLIKKDHLTDFYSEIHPDLVVPAFVHDGQLHLESMDIVAYLDDAFGGDPIIPKNDPGLLEDVHSFTNLGKELHRSIRFVTFKWGLGSFGKLNKKQEAELRRLIGTGADKESLVDFYDPYNRDAIPDQISLNHLKKLDDAYQMLDKRLANGQPFLTGETLTMADIIWSAKTLRLTECGFPFPTRHPHVQRWFDQIRSRPSFKDGVMGRHRAMSIAFKTKATVENLFGGGIPNALRSFEA